MSKGYSNVLQNRERIFTFYNNKGGVSKTTTLFNMAVYLSNVLNKRTLVVDCDPQCNLTEMFFASQILDPDYILPGKSIYKILEPRFGGESNNIDISIDDIVRNAKYPRLFILKGDVNFINAEVHFSDAWTNALGDKKHDKHNYTILRRLFLQLINEYDFKYVLCDVGPSTGFTTRLVLLSCDGYFIPVIPDRFGEQSIGTLGKSISTWISQHSKIAEDFKDYDIFRIEGVPKLYGAVLQNFKINTNDQRMIRSYEIWEEKVRKNIEDSLMRRKEIPKCHSLDMNNPFVAKIASMGALIPIAQLHGSALFDIQREPVNTLEKEINLYKKISKNDWNYWTLRANDYKREISKMVEILVNCDDRSRT